MAEKVSLKKPEKKYWHQINTEYTRQKMINDLLQYLYKYCSNWAQKYEVKNTLERWLLSMANIAALENGPDPIFTETVINNPEHALNRQFIFELNEKKLVTKSAQELCLQEVLNDVIYFLKNKNKIAEVEILDTISIYHNDKYKTLTFKKYKKDISNDNYQALLTRADVESILIMGLRYHSMISSSQHWQLPSKQYLYFLDNFQAEVEGFASPFNSQILVMSDIGKFCSLFPDTDGIFGSIGNFFTADFQNKTVVVGPPYVLDILNNMAIKCIAECEKAEKLNNKIRFIITFSAWRDIDAYVSLSKSKYLEYKTELAPLKHYYTDPSDVKEGKSKVVISKFTTVIFVLNYGYPKNDYNDFNKNMII